MSMGTETLWAVGMVIYRVRYMCGCELTIGLDTYMYT